jgi:hypothetical protein
MAMTNYPNGFTGGVSLQGVPVTVTTPGKVLWVSSVVGSDAGKGTNGKPFATIDYAIGRCTDSKGDVIFVMPNHAETVAAAGGITADVIGISIIGLGNGKQTPRISLSATTSTIAVSAANVTFKNLIVNAGVAEVAQVFAVTGADCTLDGIRSYPVSTYSIESFVRTTSGGVDLVVKNCDLMQTTAPTAASIFIQLVASTRARITDNTIYATLKNDAACAVVGGTGTASTGVIIANNRLVMVGGTTQVSVVLMYSGSTGLMTDNSLAATLTTLAGMNNPASLWCNENYCTKAVAKHGILDPIVS